jgi:hypothetical protein
MTNDNAQYRENARMPITPWPVPDDSEEKKEILDLDDDGKVSLSETLRAEAGLLEEFTKEKARRRGFVGWFNRLVSRMLGRVDNY